MSVSCTDLTTVWKLCLCACGHYSRHSCYCSAQAMGKSCSIICYKRRKVILLNWLPNPLSCIVDLGGCMPKAATPTSCLIMCAIIIPLGNLETIFHILCVSVPIIISNVIILTLGVVA